MIRSLPARYAPVWPVALGLALVIPTVWMAASILTLNGPLAHAQDWDIFGTAGRKLLAGENPYAGSLFRWNPLTGYLFAALTVLPFWVWAVAHVAVVLTLPRKLALLCLIAWPFWFDVLVGNIMAFVVVLAYYAIEGRRWAVIGFMDVAILVPRPLMLPVLVWVLWKQPWSRLPFLGLAVAIGMGTLATGWTAEYLARLGELDTRYIVAWGPFYPAMLALGAWLTWKGRLGLASLAASPYLIVNYVLMIVLELRAERALRDLDRHDSGGLVAVNAVGTLDRARRARHKGAT